MDTWGPDSRFCFPVCVVIWSPVYACERQNSNISSFTKSRAPSQSSHATFTSCSSCGKPVHSDTSKSITAPWKNWEKIECSEMSSAPSLSAIMLLVEIHQLVMLVGLAMQHKKPCLCHLAISALVAHCHLPIQWSLLLPNTRIVSTALSSDSDTWLWLLLPLIWLPSKTPSKSDSPVHASSRISLNASSASVMCNYPFYAN